MQSCLCTPREAQGFHTHFMTTKNRERRNSFRRANCVPSGTRLRRVSGLWSIGLPHSTARQPAGLPTSFLQLFSFWQRKKWNVSPFQGTKFCNNFVGGKNYIFFPIKSKNIINKIKRNQSPRQATEDFDSVLFLYEKLTSSFEIHRSNQNPKRIG